MRQKLVGNKRDVFLAVIKNAESSSSIPRGTPVVLVANGTDDGLSVVLPGTAGDNLCGVFPYGITVDAIAAGDYGEAIVFGYCGYVKLTRATRAASTDSWTSSASIAVGGILNIDTINNALLLTAASVAATRNPYLYALMQSVASMAASASATSDTRTVITTGVKIFVRML